MSLNNPGYLDRYGSWVWRHLSGLVLVFGLIVLAANVVNLAWPLGYRELVFQALFLAAVVYASVMFAGIVIPIVRGKFGE